jgi:twitching motility protein PilT
MAQEMLQILKTAVEKHASDIHIVVGKPPMVRIRGEIQPLPDFPIVKPEDTQALIY